MLAKEEIHTHTLSSGVRLIHKQVDTALVSHLGIMINCGSREENNQEHGLAHFIEHCIFKGTKKRKAIQILNRLDNVGGELNAYTAKEETCYYASFINTYYERALELICDITFQSIFPEKEIEKEKQVVLEEIHAYQDSPAEQIFDDFDEILFANHQLGKNVLGTEKSLQSFKPKHLQTFIKKHYTTDRIVVVSVGNIDFNKLIALAEGYVVDVKKTPTLFERTPFKPQHKQSITIEKPLQQLHSVIGTHAFHQNSSKRLPMILLNNMLGGAAMNSILNWAVRERNGWVYDISSSYNTFSDTGMFSIYFGCAPQNYNKVNTVIYKELKKLKTQKITDSKLRIAKKQLLGHIALSQESNLNTLFGIGKSMLIKNEIEPILTTVKKIEKITAADILSVAQIFDEQKMVQLTFKPV